MYRSYFCMLFSVMSCCGMENKDLPIKKRDLTESIYLYDKCTVDSIKNWIPVTTALPESGRDVLATNGEVVWLGDTEQEIIWDNTNNYLPSDVTHWVYLSSVEPKYPITQKNMHSFMFQHASQIKIFKDCNCWYLYPLQNPQFQKDPDCKNEEHKEEDKEEFTP